MAHRTEKPRHAAFLKSLLPAFAFLLLLSHSPSVMAQWSAPDSGGNTSATGAGRVGIGIATPNKGKLDVRFDEGVAAGEHGIIYAARPDMTGGVYMGYKANGTAPTGGYFRGTADLPLFLGTKGAPEALVIANNGDIGIGVVPSKGRFELRADLGVAAGEHGLLYASRGGVGSGGIYMGYRANGTAATGGYLRSTADLPLFVGTNATPEAVVVANNGNVGIGIASPSQSLHLKGKGLVQNTGTASAFVMDRTDGKIAAFGAGGVSATVAYDDTGVFKIESNTRANIIAGTFGTGATSRLVIDGAGNMGVGIDTPTAKLHVAGNITVDGNINAKYQDVAEWVPSRQKLAAGTVVILDPEHSNHVLASTASYDTAVAGVISAQPGIALGEAGEGKTLVATTGRVKVKVDATRASIKIGDLLVTSDVAGVAMKSEPVSLGGRKMHAPGTIIGKALEPLAGGTGEILVLLSLQ
jgi:hypothetical protein